MPKSKKKPQQKQQEHKHDSSCNHEHGGHDHGGHDHSHSHGGGGHDHDHSHSHGGGHDHEHSHSHGGGHDHDHSHSHGGGHDHGHSHSHGGGGHEHGGHSHGHGNCDHDHGHGHSHEPQPPYVDPLDELAKRLSNTRISTCAAIAEKNASVGAVGANGEKIEYTSYTGEEQMKDIMALIEKDLSEPYTIFTYRYFISDWPSLCILAMIDSKIIGVVVCKLEKRQRGGAPRSRGYIAMLAVDNNHRKLGIGSRLVREAIYKMILEKADEVVLETEIKNQAALALYETLAFIRDKRLHKYYLNGGDAFRLVLPLSAQFLAPSE